MRFLVDENLPEEVADAAISRGHEAVWVRDVLPGVVDAAILERLIQSQEVLVTGDIRFANVVLNLIGLGSPVAGVVLIREQGLSRLRRAWEMFLENPLETRGIVVVSEDKIRVRRVENTSR